MEILYVLIPIALVFAALGVLGYFWCVRTKQFSDPKGTAARVLLDDDKGSRDEVRNK